MFEEGLAYQDEVTVSWCPALGTVLANEEIVDGRSERGGHPVVRRPMRQWLLKITEYADRLLEGLDDLDWPESTKEMQRNWIGRSEGAEVDFDVVDHPEETIRVYTTRPETLFGATYMVLAPEHPLVNEITTDDHHEEVLAYQEEARQKSELERTELQDEKSGVPTGAYAVNPVNEEEIPIWVADYVLTGYGTGAIMAVPAHDDRDYDFARRYDLPVREVVSGGNIQRAAYTKKEGTVVNSSNDDLSINGLTVPEAKKKITEWLEARGKGAFAVNYKLRDWLFSRQRYWGEPFPILHGEDGETIAVEDDELPVELPEMEEFRPEPSQVDEEEPRPPLSRAPDEWKYVERDGKVYERELNTMPQWAGSCWYYLRFIDPHNPGAVVDDEKESEWMPVDLYVGGAEHSVLHLLYARFWHKVLYDIGVVSTKEPFQKLVHQGMILGEREYTLYRTHSGRPVSAREVDSSGVHKETGQHLRQEKIESDVVEKRGDEYVWAKDESIVLDARAHKMSKSRGNVINPDDVVEQYGADALRLYEMFMGPLEQVKPWSMDDVEGVFRFLNRVWRLIIDEETGDLRGEVSEEESSREQLHILHVTIQRVTDDIEEMKFNTAISAMMEFVNEANKWDPRPQQVLEVFVRLLNPFAPHLTEELWRRLGHDETIAYEPWPEVEQEYLEKEEIEIAVQVNGTVRGTINVPTEAEEEEVLATARAHDNVSRYLTNGTVRREIYVPGRIVNFVVAED
jgi:leucyl-tRNA synthetase